jgi:hypothetical protein
MTFSISGPVYQDGRIVLEGMRPVFKNCRATAEMKFDRLEFTFIENIKPELLDGVTARAREDAADVPAVVDTQADTVASPRPTPNTAKVDVAALLKAGMDGDAAAFKELARIFANGEGVSQSTERSLNFLKKAGELGDREARLEWARAILGAPSSSAKEIEQATLWKAGREYPTESEGDPISSQSTDQVAEEGQVSDTAAPFQDRVFLRCFEGVQCDDRLDVLGKMREAWFMMQDSNSRATQIYADLCLEAFQRLDDLNPAIPFHAGIVQPQLDICNTGLYELYGE